MIYRALLRLFLILTISGISQAKRAYRIELKNLSCAANDPLIADELTCIVHRKSIIPTLSVRFSLKKTIKKFDIFFNVNIMKKDNSKLSVAHAKLDGCKYLSSFYGTSRYGQFFKRIQSASNLPKKCPVQANQVYEIRNYSILADEFPPGVPAMTYQLLIKILMPDNSALANVVIEGSSVY